MVVDRSVRPDRLNRGSFCIIDLALNSPLFREIAGMQDFVSDLFFRKTAARCVQGPSHVSAMQVAAVAHG